MLEHLVLHEMGHRFDDIFPELHDLAVDFLKKKSIRDLTKRQEKIKEDENLTDEEKQKQIEERKGVLQNLAEVAKREGYNENFIRILADKKAVGYEADLPDLYIGLVYPEMKTSEVLSRGLEYLFGRKVTEIPTEELKDHEEYETFILGLLAGFRPKRG
jgi:hypothetical protein